METTLETLTIRTLLGFRFVDAATELPVRDGLVVTARAEGGAGPVLRAVRTASGGYAFHGLPGLRREEYPGEEAAGSPPAPLAFLVTVEDGAGRFATVTRRVTLPAAAAESPPAGASPPGDERPPGEAMPLDFYLFSAPGRSVPPGLAAVYGRLLDALTRLPVADAVLDVEAGGRRGYGLSDEEGQVCVLFPYPPVHTVLSGSPPSGQTALGEQRWEARVRVRYDPAALEPDPAGGRPELGSIFRQRRGLIQTDPDASPPPAPVASVVQPLVYGVPAVLRTGGEPELYVEAPPSSP